MNIVKVYFVLSKILILYALHYHKEQKNIIFLFIEKLKKKKENVNMYIEEVRKKCSVPFRVQ